MQKSIKIIGNYHNHDASRIVHRKYIAPTVKENHGTVTATVRRYDETKRNDSARTNG